MDSTTLIEYQRAIVVAAIDEVEWYLGLAPAKPDGFMWTGQAKELYSDELSLLRNDLRATRTELEAARFYIDIAIAAGA
jgi:hypothetical protein